jgi:UvrD-like helicase family protein
LDSCEKEIRAEKGGNVERDELIQGLALRFKEPPRDPSSVTLLTIHASKGLEFDILYVAGLAESIMLSWQSINEGNQSPETGIWRRLAQGREIPAACAATRTHALSMIESIGLSISFRAPTVTPWRPRKTADLTKADAQMFCVLC